MVGRDELGHRSETVRRANLSAIVRELHDAGPLVAIRPRRAHRTHPQRDPRAHRRAGRRRPRRPRSAAALDGTPGRPSPLVRPNPHGAVVLGLEIGRGLAGGRGRRSRWRGARPSPGRSAARVARASTTSPRTWPGWPRACAIGCRRTMSSSVSASPSSGSSGAATAWCRWRRTWAGATSRSASGWPSRCGTTVPISLANESDLAVIAEQRRGAARGARNVVLSVGLHGRRRWPDRGRLAAPSAPPATAARSVTCRSTRTASRAGAARSGAGRRRSAAARCCAVPATRPKAAPKRCDAVMRDAEAGSPVALDGARRDRPLARHRDRRPHQHPESRS